MNAKMPELKHCFESAGFSEVCTILSSGNVAFSTRATSSEALERRAEKAMQVELGRSFSTIVRPASYLQKLIDPDPYLEFKLSAAAKRIITFLRRPSESRLTLPMERDGARILKVLGTEVLAAYLPSDKGPVFMTLLERTFGKEITTRTLETVTKCARA